MDIHNTQNVLKWIVVNVPEHDKPCLRLIKTKDSGEETGSEALVFVRTNDSEAFCTSLQRLEFPYEPKLKNSILAGSIQGIIGFVVSRGFTLMNPTTGVMCEIKFPSAFTQQELLAYGLCDTIEEGDLSLKIIASFSTESDGADVYTFSTHKGNWTKLITFSSEQTMSSVRGMGFKVGGKVLWPSYHQNGKLDSFSRFCIEDSVFDSKTIHPIDETYNFKKKLIKVVDLTSGLYMIVHSETTKVTEVLHQKRLGWELIYETEPGDHLLDVITGVRFLLHRGGTILIVNNLNATLTSCPFSANQICPPCVVLNPSFDRTCLQVKMPSWKLFSSPFKKRAEKKKEEKMNKEEKKSSSRFLLREEVKHQRRRSQASGLCYKALGS